MDITQEEINQRLATLRASLISSEELRARFNESRIEVAREFGLPDEYLDAIANFSARSVGASKSAVALVQSDKPYITFDAIYTDLWIVDVPTGYKLTLNHEACVFLNENEVLEVVDFAIGCCGALGMLVAGVILAEKIAIRRTDKGKGVHFNINPLEEASLALCLPLGIPACFSCMGLIGLIPRPN